MSAVVRDATPEELGLELPEGAEPVAWLGAFEGDERVGRICLTKTEGQYVAHDFESDGDTEVAALLYRAALARAKEVTDKVFTRASTPRVIEFYRRVGWQPEALILSLELHS